MNAKEHLLNHEYQQRSLRAAEQQHQAQEARRKPAQPRHNAALAYLGRKLEQWGADLQAQHALQRRYANES